MKIDRKLSKYLLNDQNNRREILKSPTPTLCAGHTLQPSPSPPRTNSAANHFHIHITLSNRAYCFSCSCAWERRFRGLRCSLHFTWAIRCGPCLICIYECLFKQRKKIFPLESYIIIPQLNWTIINDSGSMSEWEENQATVDKKCARRKNENWMWGRRAPHGLVLVVCACVCHSRWQNIHNEKPPNLSQQTARTTITAAPHQAQQQTYRR